LPTMRVGVDTLGDPSLKSRNYLKSQVMLESKQLVTMLS